MMEITLASFVAVAIIIIATACMQAVVGFGFALLSVPIMIQVIGFHQAVILATFIGTANNVFQNRELRRDQDVVQVKRFLYASFLGAPLGAIAFRFADQQVLKSSWELEYSSVSYYLCVEKISARLMSVWIGRWVY